MIAGVTTIRVTEFTPATATGECRQRKRARDAQRRFDEDQNMASPGSVVPAAGTVPGRRALSSRERWRLSEARARLRSRTFRRVAIALSDRADLWLAVLPTVVRRPRGDHRRRFVVLHFPEARSGLPSRLMSTFGSSPCQMGGRAPGT